MSVASTTRFSANYGEQVWWRPIGYEYPSGKWLRSNWATYRAVPGDGSILFNSTTGTIEFTYTTVQALPLFTSSYGVWVRPAIEVYTHRGGYQARWVGATVLQGYGEIPTDWCYTRAL